MKNRLFFIPAIVITLSLLIVGSCSDLNISNAIVHLNNGFSHFMAGFTIVPIGLLLGFVLGTLFKMVINKEYKNVWINIVLCVVSFAGLLGGAYFLGGYFTSYHAYNITTLKPLFSILIGLLITITGSLFGFFFYEKLNRKDLIKTYLLVFITVMLLVLIIQTLKILFPRLRYTSVVAIKDQYGVNYFRAWYNTNFSLSQDFVKQFKLVNAEEIKSFPSGHSNISLATAFVMMFIPKLVKKVEGKEVLFFYIGFTFFLLVAFSRIFIGAHYLSDTMFAGTLGLLVIFISNEIYLRKLI